MVLQHSPVIVEDGKRGTRLNVEVVRGSRVVIIVNDGGEEKSKDLEIRQPVLNARLGDEPVGGLEHIAGVQVVVVGIGVLGVALLQVAQQHLKDGGGDLVLVQAAMLLQQMISCKKSQ